MGPGSRSCFKHGGVRWFPGDVIQISTVSFYIVLHLQKTCICLIKSSVVNIYIYMGAQKYDGQEQPSYRASRLLKLWTGVMSSSPFKPQRRWPLAVQTLCDILAPRSFCPPKMWVTWEPRRAEVGETSSWDKLSTWRISKSHLHKFGKLRRLRDTQWNSNCQPKKQQKKHLKQKRPRVPFRPVIKVSEFSTEGRFQKRTCRVEYHQNLWEEETGGYLFA